MPLQFSSPITLGAAVLGLALVFAGRQLFWLFVGTIGFLAGLRFAPLFVPPQAHGEMLLIGLCLGILGALLAFLFQKLTIAAAGWMAGGLLAVRFALEVGWNHWPWLQIAFLTGAIFAAVLFSALFDWALVVLTAVVGAMLVIDGWETASNVALAIGAGLVVVGIAVQSRSLETM